MTKSEPTSILCFRNGSIGNTLAAVPALRALRGAFPDAKLYVVVDTIGFELLEHCPWIDRLIVYEKRGKDKGLRAYWAIVKQLRELRPSHAVLFKRFFRNGLLAVLSGADIRAGFETDGKAPFLNVKVPYDETIPIVDLNLKLAQALGAEPRGRELKVFLSEEDRIEATEIIGQLPQPIVTFLVAHYGGMTTPPDFIPPKRFADVLQSVNREREPIFLIGYGEKEAAWASELAKLNANVKPVCGLPVRVNAALMERARLFVGFNSGPAHLAAAVDTPEILLFRPDERVAAEIRKWCPPSEHAHPFVPPAADDDAAWKNFLGNVWRVAARDTAILARRRGKLA